MVYLWIGRLHIDHYKFFMEEPILFVFHLLPKEGSNEMRQK